MDETSDELKKKVKKDVDYSNMTEDEIVKIIYKEKKKEKLKKSLKSCRKKKTIEF